MIRRLVHYILSCTALLVSITLVHAPAANAQIKEKVSTSNSCLNEIVFGDFSHCTLADPPVCKTHCREALKAFNDYKRLPITRKNVMDGFVSAVAPMIVRKTSDPQTLNIRNQADAQIIEIAKGPLKGLECKRNLILLLMKMNAEFDDGLRGFQLVRNAEVGLNMLSSGSISTAVGVLIANKLPSLDRVFDSYSTRARAQNYESVLSVGCKVSF